MWHSKLKTRDCQSKNPTTELFLAARFRCQDFRMENIQHRNFHQDGNLEGLVIWKSDCGTINGCIILMSALEDGRVSTLELPLGWKTLRTCQLKIWPWNYYWLQGSNVGTLGWKSFDIRTSIWMENYNNVFGIYRLKLTASYWLQFTFVHKNYFSDCQVSMSEFQDEMFHVRIFSGDLPV